MATVEKIFRCRVDYDVENDHTDVEMAIEKIMTKALGWAHEAGVEAESTNAGPAWNAYLVFEGQSESAVRKVAQKVERYIERFRGGKILD